MRLSCSASLRTRSWSRWPSVGRVGATPSTPGPWRMRQLHRDADRGGDRSARVGGLHPNRACLDVVGEKAHAEQAWQTGAHALVADQARQIAHRVQGFAMAAPGADRFMCDPKGRSLALDRKADSHVHPGAQAACPGTGCGGYLRHGSTVRAAQLSSARGTPSAPSRRPCRRRVVRRSVGRAMAIPASILAARDSHGWCWRVQARDA